MDRSVIAPMEQMRDFDFVQGSHDILYALGGLAADILSGLPLPVVGGLVATQTTTPSLTINLSSGRIYQFAPADAVADASIAQDLTIIVQQGYAPAQTVTLIAPSAGQSQWNLIQAQFSQVDSVRTGDPTGGVVPFYNAANPTQPLTASINTVRKGLCVIQVVTGASATTGSEVPPPPSAGWVPLYLIDLAGGQSQVTTTQILITGPSVGTGVPGNYPVAPFIGGLLASHHGGVAGQAPKIKLGSEVQGALPYINMSPVRTLLNAPLTLYVNGTTGVDTNSGLTPSVPYKTILAAVNSIYRNYDHNGYIPTVSVANGTYTTPIFVNGLPLGANQISLVGNIVTPTACVISVTNASCIVSGYSANFYITGFSFAATGAAPLLGCALLATNSGVIVCDNVNFAACSAYHKYASVGSQVTQIAGSAGYTISGGAIYHIAADISGYVSQSSGTVILNGTPAFTAFAYSSRGSTAQITSTAYSGAATGVRYNANNNGVITTTVGMSGGSANYFPGNSVGVTSFGGIYN